MGLLRDYIWLRMIKAESNLMDSLNDDEKKSKSKRRKSEGKADSSNGRHMGLWDFLYQEIQDEKKEEEENPQSFKDMVKFCLQCLLLALGVVVIGYICYWVLTLVGSWAEHWLEALKP